MAIIKKIVLPLFLITGVSLMAQDYETKITSVSNVRMAISNFGTFGNSLDGYRDGTGNPSCEYPAGSGIEHVFEGGIWIGGKRNGGSISVTTSALDAPSGYSTGAGGFETIASTELKERSSLFDSRFYNSDAISHQDFISTLADTAEFYPGTSIRVGGSAHNSMGVAIEMETYNWNYNFSDFVVFVNLTIKNVGSDYYDDLYIGLWNNTVVRNINVTPAGAGGSEFYNKGGNGYMEDYRMAYCYDAAGDLGFTESYVGQIFLGANDKEGFHHPDIDSNFNIITNQFEEDNFETTYNAWVFNDFTAQFAAPASEAARYDKMSEGLNESPCWTDPSDPGCPGNVDYQASLNAAGNRSDLLSAGPFARFSPGDEINVTFAYVLAKKNEDGNPNSDNNLVQRQNLINNAIFAQETYIGEDINFNGVLDPDEDMDGDGEITRFSLPAPPNAPRTKIFTSDSKVEIYWADNSRNSIDPISNEKDFEGYRVYLTKLGFDVQGPSDVTDNLNLIAQYDIRGNGVFFETGFDNVRLPQPVTFPGDTVNYIYKYTIDNISNGWQYGVAVTAFDSGDEERGIASLESSFLVNDFRVFSGTAPNEDIEGNKPFVYPNPYYYGAAWEGLSNFQEESRKIIFANLPARCIIRIYTVGGDFIDEIQHNAETYNGSDIRWYQTFGAEDNSENRFSGGEHAWDLLSSESQIISRGLYMFSVEDLETGKSQTGKFVIIK